MALASLKWDMIDVQPHLWTHAEGHKFSVQGRIDEPIDGRGALYDLVAEFKDKL